MDAIDRRREWVAILLILLLAAALRLWALGEVPPGLAHDEVANWLIARDILSGRHAIYFTAAYGHEPLYQYLQAATVALFGDHWLGVRYPSAALGLLGLAVTYVLIRRLFGPSTALLTAAWLAVSFWPIFYARVGVRAILLPLTAALAAYFVHRALNLGTSAPRAQSPKSDWLLAGLFLGLSLYTYMAARILPFIMLALLIYSLFMCGRAGQYWVGLVVMFVVAILVSAPLTIWLVAHPGAEYRVAEVQEPLNRLLEGDPCLIWENILANLKFFTFAGDPWSRQNLPGRPVFADPVSALLFCGGLLVALWRWRDPRFGFLLIWLVGALGPSVATSYAPSSIRNILALVVVFVFPALAVALAGHWLASRVTVRNQPADSSRSLPLFICRCTCVILPLVLTASLTVRDYFVRWPQRDVVRFDYQSDLTAVARQLDRLPPGMPISVAGLSVDTMDGPSLELATRRDVSDVRLCDTRQTLLIPAGPDAWLFVPGVVPFDADLQARLLTWGATVETEAVLSFTGYRLSGDIAFRRALERLDRTATLPDGTPARLPASFGGRLTFLGYEQIQPGTRPGETLTLLTYWRVEDAPAGSVKIFLHLMGGVETPIVQHDGLESPPWRWVAGDVIIQKHVIFLPLELPPGRYALQLGVYEVAGNIRLPVLTADRLLLYSLAVAE